MLLLLIYYHIGHAENSVVENSLLDLLIRTRIFFNTHKNSKSQTAENFYQVIVENVDWDVLLR